MPGEAAKLLAQARSAAPNSPQVSNAQGLHALKTGDAAAARDLFHAAVSADPNSPLYGFISPSPAGGRGMRLRKVSQLRSRWRSIHGFISPCFTRPPFSSDSASRSRPPNSTRHSWIAFPLPLSNCPRCSRPCNGLATPSPPITARSRPSYARAFRRRRRGTPAAAAIRSLLGHISRPPQGVHARSRL